jgi:hypothetical protein
MKAFLIIGLNLAYALPEWLYGRKFLIGLFFACIIGASMFPKKIDFRFEA